MDNPLSYLALTPETKHWVEKSMGANSKFISAKRLAGATTAALFRITLEDSSGGQSYCVLRLFTDTDWLLVEPDIPIHEAAALEFVSAARLPVPELIACDSTGAECSVPAILMSRVPGKVDLTPRNMDEWLRQQAEFLFRLHALDGVNFAWSYRPYNQLSSLTLPQNTPCPKLWQNAIEIVRSAAPESPLCFIHRDFHPMNLLWQQNRLSGVVDWVNACRGPAGIDVGWCRHNLACAYGLAAADRFLEICQTVLGTTWSYHPYWDLITLMDLLPGPFQVYPPWHDFGLKTVTNSQFSHRLEQYLASIVAKF